MRPKAPGAGVKKGIFFALSALLLASVLIALASGIADVTSRARRTATSIMDIDFASRAHADAQSQAIKIMSSWSNVTCQNSTIAISESLPIGVTFASDLANMEEFYGEYLNANVSANLTGLANGSYMIAPQGMEISHTGTTVLFQNNASAQGDQVMSYNITLTFPAGMADSADWAALSNASSNATGINVTVKVMDASYTLYKTITGFVERGAESRINITQGGATVGYVRFFSPSSCEIYHSNAVNLKAMIEMASPVYAQTHENITSSAGRATKSSPARIC